MKRARGFTLFEVVMAIAIVVILMATLAATLTLAFKSRRSSEDAVNSVRDIYAVGDILVAELENAAPPNANSNVDPTAAQFSAASSGTSGTTGTTPGVSASGVPTFLYGTFEGDQQTIGFYATGPEPKATIQSDARYVYFDLERQPGGTLGLVRHVETNLLGNTDPTQFPSEQAGTMQPEVLATNVQSVTFSYFDGTVWTPSWDSTQLNNTTQLPNTLPTAIKIELVLNPIHEGGQARVITRFATLWCAAASVTAASTIAATSEAAQTATGGI